MLPKYQRKKDGVKRESIEELVMYLKRNSEWIAPSAMVGKFVENSFKIQVNKSNGSSKYIDYTQKSNYTFIFSITEAISLFFAKRLIIVCFDEDNKPFILSGHFLVNKALTLGIPFKTICSYSLFSRFASTKRKFSNSSNDNHDDEENSKLNFKEKSFSSEINRLKSIGPKSNCNFQITSIFPVSNYIKIHLTNGKVIQTAISFEGLESTQDYDSNINRVYSRQCILSIKDPPGINKYILPFNK